MFNTFERQGLSLSRHFNKDLVIFYLGKDTKNEVWSSTLFLKFIKSWYKIHKELELPAAWPNGYGVRLRIGRLWVRVPSWSNVFEKMSIFDPWPWTYLKCYSEFLIQNIFYRHMPCQTVWRFITFWTATVKIHKKNHKNNHLQHYFSIFRVFSFHIISVYGIPSEPPTTNSSLIYFIMYNKIEY